MRVDEVDIVSTAIVFHAGSFHIAAGVVVAEEVRRVDVVAAVNADAAAEIIGIAVRQVDVTGIEFEGCRFVPLGNGIGHADGVDVRKVLAAAIDLDADEAAIGPKVTEVIVMTIDDEGIARLARAIDDDVVEVFVGADVIGRGLTDVDADVLGILDDEVVDMGMADIGQLQAVGDAITIEGATGEFLRRHPIDRFAGKFDEVIADKALMSLDCSIGIELDGARFAVERFRHHVGPLGEIDGGVFI